ncbi:hypothetical protein D7223_22205 [Micromonospora endolithica]|uniref:Uncharacterized protein n=1 Tax=Micromonospora endolithica TaxID=230091 RepID=A0A3A9Z3G8_9ACTN|nr:hypothetical protein D7223_22205 [Micromonospora endolithica]
MPPSKQTVKPDFFGARERRPPPVLPLRPLAPGPPVPGLGVPGPCVPGSSVPGPCVPGLSFLAFPSRSFRSGRHSCSGRFRADVVDDSRLRTRGAAGGGRDPAAAVPVRDPAVARAVAWCSGGRAVA